MTVEDIKLILYIISLALTVIWLIATIISKSQNKKCRKIAETTLKIIDYCRDAVETAEKFTSYTGTAKKEYAMTYVTNLCVKYGIAIDQEEISNQIENLIALSKKVNAKGGDK